VMIRHHKGEGSESSRCLSAINNNATRWEATQDTVDLKSRVVADVISATANVTFSVII
jgi:hypothetical protein